MDADVAEPGVPEVDDAGGLPAGDLGGEVGVSGGEVLRAVVEAEVAVTSCGEASAGATAFVDNTDLLALTMEVLGGGEAGDACADDEGEVHNRRLGVNGGAKGGVADILGMALGGPLVGWSGMTRVAAWRRMTGGVLGLAMVLWGVAVVRGQEAVPLGPAFDNPLAGISFRPPVGSKEIRRAGNADEIVQFVDDKRDWTLRVSRLRFSRGVPLQSSGNTRGLLELSVEQLKASGATELLKSEVTNVSARGVPDTGLIALRYQLGTAAPRLAQQAIIQFSDQLYYVLELDSPGIRVGSGAGESSPEEQTAVATFTQVVDSVVLLDRSDVREQQNQRLFATRAFLLNLTDERLMRPLVSERWLRLIQDGKDVGYSYVVEETSERSGRRGVLIGVRSRTMTGTGADQQQVDAESFMFTTADRRFEEWSNVARVSAAGNVRSSSEVGASSKSVRRVLMQGQLPGDATDERQPPVRDVDEHRLTVVLSGRSGGAPIEIDLPPWYLPQGMGHLLPRLLPLGEPRQYLFASYVSERAAVMMRYVDVLPEREVTLDGQRLKAVPVTDRIGIEGDPTIHYLTRDGQYLGSVNERAKISVLPTNAATLQRIWANADLSRPRIPEPGQR